MSVSSAQEKNVVQIRINLQALAKAASVHVSTRFEWQGDLLEILALVR